MLPHAVKNNEIVVAARELVYFFYELQVISFAIFVAIIETFPLYFLVVKKETAIEVHNSQIGALIKLTGNKSYLISRLF